MEEKKIPISRARRLLGKAGEKLSDDEIELLIGQCYALAEVMFEHFKFGEKLRKAREKHGKS